MLINPPLHETDQVYVETINVNDEDLGTDDNFDSLGLPAVCAVPDVHVKHSTLSESTSEQATDALCQQAVATVGIPGSSYAYDWNGILVRTAPIDGAIQSLVSTFIHAFLLHWLSNWN